MFTISDGDFLAQHIVSRQGSRIPSHPFWISAWASLGSCASRLAPWIFPRSSLSAALRGCSSQLILSCRIALVLDYFQLEEKKGEPVQKNGTDKCNSEKGKNDKCKKQMQMKNASLRKEKKQLEKQMELNNASFREAKLTIAKQMN